MKALEKYNQVIKESNHFLEENDITIEAMISKIKSFDANFDIEAFVIVEINKLTNEIFSSSENEIPLSLSKEEVNALMKESKRDPLKFLYYYHLYYSIIAYELIFKDFKSIIEDEIYFFVLLIDKLRKDFNTELFITSKHLGNCNGFIFNLESGTSHNDKMGIVLTPLALKSTKTFLSTLIHELSHRLLYIENSIQGKKDEKIEHEYNSYFAENFILKKLFNDLNQPLWLDDVFGQDVYKISEGLFEKDQDFMEMVFFKFRKELKSFYTSFIEHNSQVKKPVYSNSEIKKMYNRASNIHYIPKRLRAISDFTWFYTSRLAILHKMGKYDPRSSLLTYLILFLHFSKKYDQKYSGENIAVFDNVTFQASNQLGQVEKIYIVNFINQFKTLNNND